MQKTFKATLQKKGSKTLLLLPFDPNKAWGQKSRHYVHGLVAKGNNEARLRALIQQAEDGYCIVLGAAFRRDTGIMIGDDLTVTIEPEGPQLYNMSTDIVSALEFEPDAVEFFNGLATHYRKNYVNWVESAKRPETRVKRIEEMVALLKAGKQKK